MRSDIKEFLGVIIARGGSKRIPSKNMKKLMGKPLIKYTFDAVKGSKLMQRCIISTDSDKIIKYSKKDNIDVPFKRPSYLALDDSKTIDVLLHATHQLKIQENYIPDYIVTLQPTSPLRTSEDIDNAIKIVLNNSDADSLVSVVEIPHQYNPYSAMKLKGQYLEHYIKDTRIYRSQDKPLFYARNGPVIAITKYELLINERKIIGNYCLPYFMSKENSIDIDDIFDWKIAEFLIKEKNSFNF